MLLFVHRQLDWLKVLLPPADLFSIKSKYLQGFNLEGKPFMFDTLLFHKNWLVVNASLTPIPTIPDKQHQVVLSLDLNRYHGYENVVDVFVSFLVEPVRGPFNCE